MRWLARENDGRQRLPAGAKPAAPPGNPSKGPCMIAMAELSGLPRSGGCRVTLRGFIITAMSKRHGELYGDAFRRRSPKISAATPPPGGREATDRQTAVFRTPKIQSRGDRYNAFLLALTRSRCAGRGAMTRMGHTRSGVTTLQ